MQTQELLNADEAKSFWFEGDQVKVSEAATAIPDFSLSRNV
ncbi:MAG: hypothetical protein WA110_08045 [Anaerolineaceae bacterium]